MKIGEVPGWNEIAKAAQESPKIVRIAPHGEPVHLDEFVAAVLAREFGESIWPGVSTAEFVPFGDGENFWGVSKDPTVLKLGMGGIRGQETPSHVVDEHGLPDSERSQHCATTLMAERLGLDDKTMYALRLVLAEVLDHDKRNLKEGEHGHLANLVLMPSIEPSMKLEVVRAWVKGTIERQRLFWEAAELLLPQAEVWQLPHAEGEVFFCDGMQHLNEGSKGEAASTSNREGVRRAFPAVARSRGAAIIVIRDPSGRFQIIANRAKSGLDMRRVAARIRARECGLRNREVPKSLSLLSSRGTLPHVPEWHFSDGDLLNGARNPITMLTPEIIKEILTQQVSEEAWWNSWTAKFFPGQSL